MSDTTIFRDTHPESQLELLLRGRLKLLENGYSPVQLNGKRPLGAAWNSKPITRESLAYDTFKNTNMLNTGCLTGKFCVPDIDLRNDDHTVVIVQLALDMLGKTRLFRRGSKGMALGYYNPNPGLGRVVHRDDDTTKALVEILGIGNQLACFGIHPDTNRPYTWYDESPFTIPLAELPRVTDEQILAFHDAVEVKLRELGYTPRSVKKGLPKEERKIGSASDVASGSVTDMFLQVFPTGRRSAQGFVNFSCPSCHCDDARAGYMLTDDGGFRFYCFHSGCAYFKPTGWTPGGGLGADTIELFRLLGGDTDELPRNKRRPTFDETLTEKLKALYDKTVKEYGTFRESIEQS